MNNFLVCAYKSQDFAQSEKSFARWHDWKTVRFRKSVQQYGDTYLNFINQSMNGNGFARVCAWLCPGLRLALHGSAPGFAQDSAWLCTGLCLALSLN